MISIASRSHGICVITLILAFPSPTAKSSIIRLWCWLLRKAKTTALTESSHSRRMIVLHALCRTHVSVNRAFSVAYDRDHTTCRPPHALPTDTVEPARSCGEERDESKRRGRPVAVDTAPTCPPF